jgi:Zn-dependent protease
VKSTFRLGRIAGIPIGVNWTWLLVFAFLVWSLASSVFPDTNPGLSTAEYAGMGIAAALLFFGSLLLHELGHAVQARREGVQIDGITLWIFGGVARLRGTFPSAGAEFRIAIAGPIVTAVLAGAFVGLVALTHFGTAVDGMFAWLGYINLLLLAFNLLPALPLDGGRIFRSALWRLRRDFVWATVLAARVGQAFTVLMMVAGVAILLFGGVSSGLWFVLLGWFLLGAAAAEARSVARLRRGVELSPPRDPSPHDAV